MPTHGQPIRGRGAGGNPANRFERIAYVDTGDHAPDEDEMPDERAKPPTEFYKDLSRSIISRNTSPDISFDASINPYRGCEHGCAYCYARPTHEYLGWSAGLDFETRIMVKENAAELLREQLSSPQWQPQTLAMSGVTDPYQPIERKLRITRSCLEVLAEFRNPVGIVTKNHLVTRDLDVLKELARNRAVCVHVSVTSLNAELSSVLEPRTSHPARRLAAIEALSSAGVPVGVLVAPIIPGLTDHEIPSILKASAEAGAGHAGCVMLRLPYGVAGMFEEWLEAHFPDRRKKVLDRIRQMRGGQLNESRFGDRMWGKGIFAEQIEALFETGRRQAGLADCGPSLSTDAFRRPGTGQMMLFE